RTAVERAEFRCQDDQCGVSAEWQEFRAQLDTLGLGLLHWGGGATKAVLAEIRDSLVLAAKKSPRAFLRFVTRYKLTGTDPTLLEVDHDREDADGGEPTLDNAVVRCVFCHAQKTAARIRTRTRRAPGKKWYQRR
ncbi:MAG: HNH endonuclease, partial [Deltaproteobacteria bacterium]|nr:HNH endonuclease [Deltaproteobacteria bacterium]